MLFKLYIHNITMRLFPAAVFELLPPALPPCAWKFAEVPFISFIRMCSKIFVKRRKKVLTSLFIAWSQCNHILSDPAALLLRALFCIFRVDAAVERILGYFLICVSLSRVVLLLLLFLTILILLLKNRYLMRLLRSTVILLLVVVLRQKSVVMVRI